MVNKCIEENYEVIGISRSSEPSAEYLPYKWKESLEKANREGFNQRFKFINKKKIF